MRKCESSESSFVSDTLWGLGISARVGRVRQGWQGSLYISGPNDSLETSARILNLINRADDRRTLEADTSPEAIAVESEEDNGCGSMASEEDEPTRHACTSLRRVDMDQTANDLADGLPVLLIEHDSCVGRASGMCLREIAVTRDDDP